MAKPSTGAALDRLAESHGIQLAYRTEGGEQAEIADETKVALLHALGVDPKNGEEGAFADAAQTPTTGCAVPDAVAGQRCWGIACQLYALRSRRSSGIGDFEDLARLAEIAARAGADFVGVNPLHALFSADCARISPYSPSSRRFLNPLYIALDDLDRDAARVGAELSAGGDDLVDYVAVGRAKHAVLERVFAERFDEIADSQAFERFRVDGGSDLEAFALFEALSESRVAVGEGAGWHAWPRELQDRHSDAVARFAADNGKRVLFHQWLQFVAEEQLAEAQARAKAAGMAIGLYLDCAVGTAPDGADTWADPDLTVTAARVGSPPDMFNSAGQDWGLAPLSPKELAARDYKPLAHVFAAMMRNAGAIRIDHAMGLARLWWIPQDMEAGQGGYVRYPLGAMVDTVARASVDNSCLVIGEDLGTVPSGFRETMADADLLSYRVLYFECGEDGFHRPGSYPERALACVTTHDLPTLAGWWAGHDIALRAETGRQPAEATEREERNRAGDRKALVAALDEAGLNGTGAASSGAMTTDLALAVHRYLARTPSELVAVQLDDCIGAERQPNLPGTVDEYPNWRIRSPVLLEELTAQPQFEAITAAMRHERPKAR